MTTHESLQWRYATKQFDTNQKVSDENINYILEAGRLSATSYGLQPFSIIVVTDEAIKQDLLPHAYGQTQVSENTALIVLAAKTTIDAEFITEYTNRIEIVRGLPTGTVDGFKEMMINDLTNRTDTEVLIWAQKQCYIALGTMMVAAAERGVDSCPMEGFSASAYNEILGLDEKNLHATVLLPIGHRAESDETQHYTKVRKPLTDITIAI
jgi:nitroreductase